MIKRSLNYQMIRLLGFVTLALAVSACMPKVEDGGGVEEVVITSHDIDRNGPNSKITLYGTCPIATDSYRANIEEVGWDVYSPSITAWSEGSGQPIGTCVNGVLNIQYPIPKPTESRIVTFRVKAKLSDGQISLYPAIRDVNYNLPSLATPGYDVTSGGGFGTSGSITIHASIGITHSYQPTPSTGSVIVPGAGDMSIRSGLQALIYDETL